MKKTASNGSTTSTPPPSTDSGATSRRSPPLVKEREKPAPASGPKPAHFLSAADSSFRYVEKTNPDSSNLDFLTYGVYELAGEVQSGLLAHPGEEALLFCWKGKCTASLGGKDY